MEQVTRVGAYGLAILQGSILLTTKLKGPYKGLLDLPGGGIEFGESPEQTLRREFEEEVAMSFDSVNLLNNLTYGGTAIKEHSEYVFHHIGMIYRVDGIQSIPDAVPQDPFDWYALSTLNPEMLTPFARIAITQSA